MLQSFIARLNGSLMALNRTSAWEVLHVFYLTEMSHFVARESAVSDNTMSCRNTMCGKMHFHEGN